MGSHASGSPQFRCTTKLSHVQRVFSEVRVVSAPTSWSSTMVRPMELPTCCGGSATLRLVTHPANRGYGAALISAFAYAQEHDFEVLVTMDCDGQHEPARIPVLLEAIHDVDIVSGSRYLRDFRQDTPAPTDRRNINRTITAEINERFGLNLTDAFCGFKAYRRDALAKLHITETGWGMPLQLWVQAARIGLRIKEIGVPRRLPRSQAGVRRHAQRRGGPAGLLSSRTRRCRTTDGAGPASIAALNFSAGSRAFERGPLPCAQRARRLCYPPLADVGQQLGANRAVLNVTPCGSMALRLTNFDRRRCRNPGRSPPIFSRLRRTRSRFRRPRSHVGPSAGTDSCRRAGENLRPAWPGPRSWPDPDQLDCR